MKNKSSLRKKIKEIKKALTDEKYPSYGFKLFFTPEQYAEYTRDKNK